MSQTGGTKLRIDPDIERAVWVKLAEEGVPLNRLVNSYLRGWIAGESASSPIAKPPADMLKSLHHIHGRLAKVTAELHRLIAIADRRNDGSDTISDSQLDSLEGRLTQLADEVGESAGDTGRGGGAGKNADSVNRKTAGRLKIQKPTHLLR